VDSRFETARSSSALKFCALAAPETSDRATTTTTSHHQSVTGSHNFTFGVQGGLVPSKSNYDYKVNSVVSKS
jgi:hypothetical protein